MEQKHQWFKVSPGDSNMQTELRIRRKTNFDQNGMYTSKYKYSLWCSLSRLNQIILDQIRRGSIRSECVNV